MVTYVCLVDPAEDRQAGGGVIGWPKTTSLQADWRYLTRYVSTPSS
jgi:hypothetical protein